jgi:hypothetical protein
MSDGLDNQTRDHLLALTRGAANAVPFVGGLLGELVTTVIPEQRQDRIVRYLRALGARMEKLEGDVAKAAIENPEKIDLIESGGYLSVRATSQKRIEQIAEVVANGLTADDAEIVRRKRLLALLGEIDDDEVAILAAYGQSYGGMNPQAWESIDRPSPPHSQAGREVIEANKLYDLGVERLLRLNVLERRMNLKKGQVPEFDSKSGLPKGSIQISYLGRMLLRSMGIQLPFEE